MRIETAMQQQAQPAPVFRLRLARQPQDVARAQALRGRAFHGAGAGPDGDALDTRCLHLLVEEADSGRLAACCRVLPLADGAEAARASYSARFYGLDGFARLRWPMLEIGRFCTAPGQGAPEALRLIWAGIASLAEDHEARLLFGSASFAGVDPGRHGRALACLAARHLAPPELAPTRRAPELHVFAREGSGQGAPATPAAVQRDLLAVPPLLRGYLALGARVSDHAVIDRQMNTLHVLTLLDVGWIPPARARMLRALAARVAPDMALRDGRAKPAAARP